MSCFTAFITIIGMVKRMTWARGALRHLSFMHYKSIHMFYFDPFCRSVVSEARWSLHGQRHESPYIEVVYCKTMNARTIVVTRGGKVWGRKVTWVLPCNLTPMHHLSVLACTDTSFTNKVSQTVMQLLFFASSNDVYVMAMCHVCVSYKNIIALACSLTWVLLEENMTLENDMRETRGGVDGVYLDFD